MTLPGEGVPQRPDDELIAADQQKMTDGVAQQAEVEAALAESETRVAPWRDSIDAALSVSTAVVAEYGARANSGTTNEVELDAEDGVPVVSDADLFLARLRPSTVIVQVEKNEISLKNPRSLWNRYLSYAKETPLKYGWTVAERQVSGSAEAGEAADPTAESGGRLGGLLADIDGPAPAAKPKVEVGDLDEEDDAIPYDVEAIVERVVVVNGAKNALLLIKGKRGELDKAFEEGKDAPTRIASIKAPKDKKSGKEDKTRDALEEYVNRNNFADVTVSVLSKEAIGSGQISIEKPEEFAELVYNGLCDLVERVKQSRLDRDPVPAATRRA